MSVLPQVEHILLYGFGFTSTNVQPINSQLLDVFVDVSDTILNINFGAFYLDGSTPIEWKYLLHMRCLFVVQNVDLMNLLLLVEDEN